MTENTLDDRIENSKPVDFGSVFTNGIELFKKVWLQGFVHLLLNLLLLLPLFIIIYIPMLLMAGIGGYQDYEYGSSDGPEGVMAFVVMCLLIILIILASIGAIMVQFGMTAHFYRVCKQVDLGLEETSTYFMFFKKKYLKKVIILSLAKFGISIVAVMLCYLPLFYVMVPLHLLGVIFAFNPEMNPSDLVKASFKFGNKVWGMTFLLILIASSLAQLGVLACFIGIFFTASFIYMPIYFIYKESLGFDQEDEREEMKLLS